MVIHDYVADVALNALTFFIHEAELDLPEEVVETIALQSFGRFLAEEGIEVVDNPWETY